MTQTLEAVGSIVIGRLERALRKYSRRTDVHFRDTSAMLSELPAGSADRGVGSSSTKRQIREVVSENAHPNVFGLS